jgi:hypothetical protein
MVKDHGRSFLLVGPNAITISTMLLAILAVPLDALKLLLLVVVGGGLLALSRWSSGSRGVHGTDLPANVPTPDPLDLVADTESKRKLWPPSAEEVAASLPFDPSLGSLQIRKFFFDRTDVTPGPEDREVFAEELHVELYDGDSGHAWWQSYFIATPRGLAKILEDKHWRYLHAPQILVFPHYDFEEIRRAVVSRLVADQVLFKDKDEGEEEFL